MIHRTYNFEKMMEFIGHVQKSSKIVDKYIEPVLATGMSSCRPINSSIPQLRDRFLQTAHSTIY